MFGLTDFRCTGKLMENQTDPEKQRETDRQKRTPNPNYQMPEINSVSNKLRTHQEKNIWFLEKH